MHKLCCLFVISGTLYTNTPKPGMRKGEKININAEIQGESTKIQKI